MLYLDGTVPKNAVVAVTLERAGGAKNGPTTAPILSAPVS
jgi:anti-sigma-K factor RskA